MFPFENWQHDTSRMLARIQSSNVALLYIQTGTGAAFNSSYSGFIKTCLQTYDSDVCFFLFTLIALREMLRF